MVFIKHCTQTSVPGRPVTGGVDDSLIKKTNLSHESIKNVEFAGNWMPITGCFRTSSNVGSRANTHKNQKFWKSVPGRTFWRCSRTSSNMGSREATQEKNINIEEL